LRRQNLSKTSCNKRVAVDVMAARASALRFMTKKHLTRLFVSQGRALMRESEATACVTCNRCEFAQFAAAEGTIAYACAVHSCISCELFTTLPSVSSSISGCCCRVQGGIMAQTSVAVFVQRHFATNASNDELNLPASGR
jgi:hypothetical protein